MNGKLNKEAINEIMKLLNEVKDVVKLIEEFGINIDSDTWSACSCSKEENILTWEKKDFEKLNNVKKGSVFYIGGNIVTGSQHEYKGEWIIAPKKLAEIQSEIFEQYLRSIMQSISLKHFDLKFSDDIGLINNCGWEHFICIDAIVKPSALNNHTNELIEQIKQEEDTLIELSASPLYENPKTNFHQNSGLVPQGNFPYMLEFFSDLIVDEDTIYQGCFGVNSRYIKDAMKLITDIEKRAKEIENKYADKGVKVTVNGLNDGCEKGMAIYVWIPYQ